jgi:hypothetical protein
MYLGLPQSRIIGSVGLDYYSDLVDKGFFSSLAAYIGFLISTYSIRKHEYSFDRIPLQNSLRLLLLFLFIVIVAIAYPAALGLGSMRFGSFGSLVVVFFVMICCSKSSGSGYDFINFLLGLFIFFMVLRGERVDFILMLACLLLFSKRNSFLSFYKIGLIAASFLLLALLGGLSRQGANIEFTQFMGLVTYALTNFGTAVDVNHVFMSSVWYYESVGFDYRPLINMLSSFIPFAPEGGVSSLYNYVWILRQHINNLGGGLFYTVFYMLLGPFGCFVGGFFYGFLYVKLFRLSGYFSVLFLSFFVMQFRLQWYGFNYFGSVVLSLLMFLMVLFILRRGGFIYVQKS